jgi:His/Glu/Gln/Arg/opine family amino acid ABC transporter permease subunit
MTWDIFLASLPELLTAALGTLRMTAFAFLFAALLGLPIAIVRLAGGAAGSLAFLYVEIVRGMPALALLFLIYFGLAPIVIVLSSFVAGVLSFGLNVAAYLA